jgi:hypothetical protein
MAVITIKAINLSKSKKVTPPIENTSDIMGKLENANRIIILMEDANFPNIICRGVNLLVRRISKVCFSLSPDMEPAVKAGTVNSTRPNSTAAIIAYNSKTLA